MTREKLSHSVLSAIFRRRGQQTERTRLVSDVSVIDDSDLRSRLLPDEQPVLIQSGDDGIVLIITTMRAHYRSDDVWLTVEHCDVVKVENIQHILARGSRGKLTNDKMTITTGDGDVVIKTEAGQPHWGIFNVLLWVVTRNRAANQEVK